jgi:mannose-6-phosphate isomerase-like protein (cupin superfamily)
MTTAMTHLVAPEAARGRARRRLNIFDTQIWIKLGSSDTGGSYTIIENVSQPLDGPPLHRHSREDESFYIVEGDFLFEVDGERIHAGPGCTVFAPRGTAHTFQNVGQNSGRYIVVAQPAGIDEFFEDVASVVGSDPSAADAAAIAALFEKYGLELLGPPMRARGAAALDG